LIYLCASHAPSVAEVKEDLRKHDRAWVEQCVMFHVARSRKLNDEALKVAHGWQAPEFPVKAKDLHMAEGPELGKKLKALEKRWVESDYRLSKEALLSD